MKTIAKLILATVVVLGAQSGQAQSPNPNITLRVLDDTSFALYMAEINNQKTKISLLDETGHILFSRLIRKKENFRRKLNLQELPTGNYNLAISNEIGTISYPVNLTEKALKIPVDERVVTFNPIIRQTNNVVSLMLFSPARQSYNLSIFNAQNELMHGENIIGTVNYSKQFDFSEAIPGSYSIVINSPGQKYTYLVPVR